MITMPKAPTPLYTHSATAHQLNVTSSTSGHSSYSYTTAHVPIEPAAPESHPGDNYYPPDSAMDIDGIDDDRQYTDGVIPDVDEGATVEAMPGVHVHIVPKAKRYDNSVRMFYTQVHAITNSIMSRMFLFELGLVVGVIT
jgi:hypothetical protein